MEDVVHPSHGRPDRVQIANIANVEPKLWVPIVTTHVVLLLLIARENPYLSHIRLGQAPKYGITETARATRYQDFGIRCKY
jgi:hypothetical protein